MTTLQLALSIEGASANSFAGLVSFAVPIVGVLIALGGFVLNFFNRVKPISPKVPQSDSAKHIEQTIEQLRMKTRSLEEDINKLQTNMIARSRRSLWFQLLVAFLLLLLIGGGGYYVWQVKTSIQAIKTTVDALVNSTKKTEPKPATQANTTGSGHHKPPKKPKLAPGVDNPKPTEPTPQEPEPKSVKDEQ